MRKFALRDDFLKIFKDDILRKNSTNKGILKAGQIFCILKMFYIPEV